MTSSRRGDPLPRLHLVTNDALLRSGSFRSRCEELLRSGGNRVALHLRGRGLGGRELWELAISAREAARKSGSRLFINDRIDVALAAGADGVQLGRDSFAVRTARELVDPAMLIGASVHDPAAAADAADGGADFLLAGTLYESRSHPGQAGSGCSWLTSVATPGKPIIGIGGITPERVTEVTAAGAYGVAVISGIWDAADPAGALERYLSNLEDQNGRNQNSG